MKNTEWHVGGIVKKQNAQRVSYVGIGDGAQHIARAVITGCVSEEQALKHATLIAAAPRLLRACKNVKYIEHCRRHGRWDTVDWNAIADEMYDAIDCAEKVAS